MIQSIVEALCAHGDASPSKLCIADGREALTYAEAWDRVRANADAMTRAGLSRGKAAVVACDQSAEFMICMLAVQLAGGVAVPLEKNAAVSRVVEIAREADAVLFVGADPVQELEDVPFFPMRQELAPRDDVRAQISFPKSGDVAEILFSTGTTGKSKGIVIEHRADVALAQNVVEGVAMAPDNVEIVPMPLSHSHGLRRTYSSIFNGSSAVIAEGVLALKKMFNLMDDYRVTSMDISPAMLSIIFKLSKDHLGDYADVLDYVQLGSAPLAEEDKERLKRLLPSTRLYNFYGSTESGCSCLLEFGQGVDKPHCVGRPAVNAVFAIVDDDHRPIASSPDRLGFIASSGPMNMREYYKEPRLTAETMSGGFVYTKDLGYIDGDGLVYMLGRNDDVINFGGVKISPEEIEAAVMHHGSVLDCACVPLPDAIAGQVPVLCIALEPGCAYDAKEFKSFLASQLDANKQPQRIEVLDAIPRTFNGKIRRNVLVETLSGE